MSAHPFPLVSVVIGVYNCARYLGQAIESVLGQTYPRVELIMVDDGSDDGSGEVARRYFSSLRYVYQPRAGMGAARNRGVGLTQGSFLAFLDADDMFRPDKLERQMAAFDRDPEVEAVFGHVREFLSPELDERVARRLRRSAERIPGHFAAAMLIRRAAFDRVGFFATTLKVGIGLDWYARATEQGLKSLMLDEIVMERRLHLNNTGLRERDSRLQYVQVVRAALDRRRKRNLSA
jgi:glycosyltransferase involved in cell wall biosynthesis